MHLLLIALLVPATVAGSLSSETSASHATRLVPVQSSDNVYVDLPHGPVDLPQEAPQAPTLQALVLDRSPDIPLRSLVHELLDDGSQPSRCESQLLLRTRSQKGCIHSGVPP